MSIFLRTLAGVLFSFSLFSVQAHDHSPHSALSATGPTYQAQGRIRKITPHSVTIAHQAIHDLNWPPMTMQFVLPTGAGPVSLSPGDRVDFTFIEGEAGYQIVSLNALR
ncbi:hypothetical protein AC791_08280 [Klebsiella sp. RIT-PI-d]|uniref:copper-binding protein n=1 Tax=Klebsiella sp. RIT-PI-d TaxID=1681196 RepID=UPI0006768E43|nr:copper-binding protein [Klebsiella sp. RIT-PI-d]KNC08702.1 hypothetical protein AC791_08280 [Klebsiella sp. RIT-PI-d]